MQQTNFAAHGADAKRREIPRAMSLQSNLETVSSAINRF
jgi:hypothetical protein